MSSTRSRAVDGVADAQAFVQGDAVVIDKQGKPIERPTAPTFGATVNEGSLSVWRIAEGRLPDGPTEVALDTITAARRRLRGRRHRQGQRRRRVA